MSDNVRFHSKWHGKNHHTLPTPGYYDSARDPIAGPGQEFMGDFYLSGAFVAITTSALSATLGAQEILDIQNTRTNIKANSANWNQGSKWTANGTDIFLTHASYNQVGIGTTVPTYPLVIAGDANSNTLFLSGYRETSNPVLSFTDDLVLSAHTGGNVGIGEASPDSKLHVKFSDTNTAIDSQLGEGIIIENSSDANNNFNSIQFSGDNSVMAQVGAQFVDHSNNAGELFFTTRNSSGSRTEKMRIDKDGKVGIGTSTPNEKLTVTGNISATGDIITSVGPASQPTAQVKLHASSTQYGTIELGGLSGGFIDFKSPNTQDSDCRIAYTRDPGDAADSGDGNLAIQAYKENNILFQTTDSSTTRMFITSSGKVAVGVYPGGIPASDQFTAMAQFTVDAGTSSSTAISADGAIVATGDITAFSTSDKQLKNNIVVISDPISKVQSINGITFEWADGAPDHLKGADYGVIAQEIEEVLPLAVTTRDTGHKAVKYEKIIPLLIEAVKDQQKQIDELKAKLKE